MKKYRVTLTVEERRHLGAVVAKGVTSARRRRRAHALLKADQGPEGPAWTDARITEAFGVSTTMLGTLRRRCVCDGLEVALNGQRTRPPGRRRKLDGAGEAQLVALCCSPPPEGRTRWTLRLLADRLVELEVVDDLSPEAVRQTLKKTT